MARLHPLFSRRGEGLGPKWVLSALNSAILWEGRQGNRTCSVYPFEVVLLGVEALRERLIGRGTDSMETIEKRIAKAEFELSKAPEFDHIVVNDDLATAVENTKQIINSFLER